MTQDQETPSEAPKAPKFEAEPTTWSPGIVGFYASCASVSIGAAVTSMVLIVFGDEPFAVPVAIFGGLMIVAGGIGSVRFLKAARKEL